MIRYNALNQVVPKALVSLEGYFGGTPRDLLTKLRKK